VKSLFVLCLTLGALPGFGETRQTPVAPIALYTQFQEDPPEAVTEALHDELDSVMAPMGLRFEWHSLTGARGNEVAVELAVLTFKGRCDVAGLMPRNGSPGALGWTHVSDGIILPFSDVDCDRIRGFVNGNGRQWQSVRGEIRGLALEDRAAPERHRGSAQAGEQSEW